MSVFAGPEISNDGLVLCLDAGNSRSYPGTGTVWTDLSGNGNNGTLLGGVGFDSANKGALAFDGTTQWVQVNGVTPLITNDFTHCAWAKRDGDTDSGIGGIFGNHFHTELAGAGMFFRNNNQIYLSAGNGSSRPSHNFELPISNQLWNFYVTRYFGTTYEFYLNGTLLDSRNTPVVQSTNTNRFAVGRWAASFGSYYINGKISDCLSYNRALTAQEIQQNFAATRGRYGV